jgi:hypothetical protein
VAMVREARTERIWPRLALSHDPGVLVFNRKDDMKTYVQNSKLTHTRPFIALGARAPCRRAAGRLATVT